MFTSALKTFSSNISANYNISNTPQTIAGAWKVYDGQKKTTGKSVSVFVFDRKSLEPNSGLRSRSSGAARRKVHDEVVGRLKKEASSLARLRHPNILELVEPVEDTRSGGLMFATEPIITTLAALLQDRNDQHGSEGSRGRNNRHRTPADDARHKEADIDELEFQKGLLQIAKGLEFLHESAGLVHGNFAPESIYINQKFDWKVSGLGFSGPPDNSSGPSKSFPIALSELLYHDPQLPETVQLNLDYTSPDFVLDGNISSSADMFSLGLIILALYSSPHQSPLKTNSNVSAYKTLFASSSTTPTANNNFLSAKPLPKQMLFDVLPRLVTRRPAQRMNAHEFQESRFFDNILVSTIRFLESLPAKTPNEKAQFMRGLPRILDQFPKSILERKLLPALLDETKDRELLAVILANIFQVINFLETGERAFTDNVLPRLREIFLSANSKDNSVERDTSKEAGLVVVLEKIVLISENCSGKEFKDDVLPILQLGLESPTHSIVDKSLECLPAVLTILDFSTIKNDLFPIVAGVFSKTSSLAIKVKGLEAFHVLCGGSPGNDANARKSTSSAILDKYTLQEKVIPLLKAIKTKEPAAMMAALPVFRQVGKIVDIDFIAMDVLPTLWSFSLGPLLSLHQFEQYMELIKALSSRIEQEQSKKLSDLTSSSTNGFGMTKSNDPTSTNSSNDLFGTSNGIEDDFERLVLGRTSINAAKGDLLGDSTRPKPQHSSSDFSWSTNHSSSMSDALTSRPGAHSRAITPDQSMANFTPLQPSSKNSGTGNYSAGQWDPSQVLQPQPTQSSFLSNAWSSSPNPLASHQTAKSWTNLSVPSPASHTTTMGWNLPPPPQQQQVRSVHVMPVMTPMQPVSRPSTFSIALPQPLSMTDRVGKKTGLDAYESLI